MIKLAETEDFVVYDGVMDEKQLASAWVAVQSEDYAIPHMG